MRVSKLLAGIAVVAIPAAALAQSAPRYLNQRDVAEALGISASAVSQRVRADGLAAIVAAHDLLMPVDPGTATGGGDR